MISSAIEINESEIIELQLSKLKGKALESEVRDILESLERFEYDVALHGIQAYLQKYNALVLHQDPEVQALKLKLKALEQKLSELSEQKDEYLKELNEFNIAYYNRLGSIIQEILRLKEQIARKSVDEKASLFEQEKQAYDTLKAELKELERQLQTLKESLDALDAFDDRYEEVYQQYQTLQEAYREKEQALHAQRQKAKEAKQEFEECVKESGYDEIKTEFEEFFKEYEHIKEEVKQRFELSEEEQKELKTLYRKASRMCHPDLVVDELKAQAITIMQALNDAYTKRDLQTVKSIWERLQSGLAFDVASEKIDDKEILEAKIAEIKEKIEEIMAEIEQIEADETLQLIQQIDDIDPYLEELAQELEREKEVLSKIIDQPISIDTVERN